mmetsp:Transcript_43902/g.106455  ORF Transcript_43902/g.106455 Transcript_43902/m.106455 type:complete len:88 (+) Transcript_43902:121-384(+)
MNENDLIIDGGDYDHDDDDTTVSEQQLLSMTSVLERSVCHISVSSSSSTVPTSVPGDAMNENNLIMTVEIMTMMMTIQPRQNNNYFR